MKPENLKKSPKIRMKGDEPAFSIRILPNNVILKAPSFPETILPYNDHVKTLIECINTNKINHHLIEFFENNREINIDVITNKRERIKLKADPSLFLNDHIPLNLEPDINIFKREKLNDFNERKFDSVHFKKRENVKKNLITLINEIKNNKKIQSEEVFTGKNKKCYRMLNIQGVNKFISVSCFVGAALTVCFRYGTKPNTHVDGFMFKMACFNVNIIDTLYDQVKKNFTLYGMAIKEDYLNTNLKFDIMKLFDTRTITLLNNDTNELRKSSDNRSKGQFQINERIHESYVENRSQEIRKPEARAYSQHPYGKSGVYSTATVVKASHNVTPTVSNAFFSSNIALKQNFAVNEGFMKGNLGGYYNNPPRNTNQYSPRVPYGQNNAQNPKMFMSNNVPKNFNPYSDVLYVHPKPHGKVMKTIENQMKSKQKEDDNENAGSDDFGNDIHNMPDFFDGNF